MNKGYWWCAKCKQEVDQADVTYSGLHVQCGEAVKWVDSIYDELVDLRAKLAAANDFIEFQKRNIEDAEAMRAAAETQRDAERAHNAVLRQALKEAKNLWGLGIEYGYSQGCHLENKRVVSDGEDLLNDICKALSATPSDSAERVQGLVDALELITRCTTCTGSAATADNALKKWRNSND